MGYISAVLQQAGHEVIQYIGDYEDSDKFALQKELFDASEGFYDRITNPLSDPYKDTIKIIDDSRPDVVGITVQAGTVVQSEIIAMYCYNHNIRTIIGGPMAMLALDTMLKCKYYDQVVGGEAERIIARVIKYPKHKAWVGIPPNDINSIPLPSRDNFKYHKNVWMGSIMTSRGCPFHCTYCAHWIMGGEIRFRDAKNILKEIKLVIEDYNQNKFRFFDDTFTQNKDRIFELCKLIWSENIEAEFAIETRVDCLNEMLIDNLVRIGVKDFKLGIESGSQKILDVHKQGYKKENIREIISVLKDYDIHITGNWMFGFPEETDEQLQETIDFIQDLDLDYNSISCLTPYPGTELFYLLEENDRRNWQALIHTQKVPPLNKSLSPDLIEKLLNVNEDKKRFGDKTGR